MLFSLWKPVKEVQVGERIYMRGDWHKVDNVRITEHAVWVTSGDTRRQFALTDSVQVKPASGG